MSMNHKQLAPASLTNKYRMHRETYELTAKLLAAENISVIFTQGLPAPALFDLMTRVLKINSLEDDQIFLTPGLVAHEVGHALFTNPTEKDLTDLKYISQLFNVVEDGYQERKMAKKFPGSRKHLKTVFDYFFERPPEDIVKDQIEGLEGFNDMEEVMKQLQKPPSKIVEIVNILNYNCKGNKYGSFKDYPDYVLDEDLVMLDKAAKLDEPLFKKRHEFVCELSDALKKYGEYDEESSELGMGGGQPLLEGEIPHYKDGDGNMVNEKGNQIDENGDEITDEDGNPVPGKFYDDNGDPVNLKGNKVDEDGNELTDENGDPISGQFTDDEGNAVNNKGNRVDEDGNEMTDENGNPIPGEFGSSMPAGQGGPNSFGGQLRPGSMPGGQPGQGDQPGPGKVDGDGQGDGQGEGDGQGDGDWSSRQDKGKKGQAGSQGKNKENSPSDGKNASLKAIEDELEKYSEHVVDHHKMFKLKEGNGGEYYSLADYQLLKNAAEHVDIYTSKSYKNCLIEIESTNNYEVVNQLNAQYQEHYTKAKMAAQLIYSQFNVKKTTSNLSKTQYKKSGVLDPTRLAQHQWNDDIFINTEIAPNESNHGFVVVLDWSGSMHGSVMQLTHRIMELSLFACLAEVQLQVFLYTTDGHHRNFRELNDVHPSAYDKVWTGSKFIKVLDTQEGEFMVNQKLKALWMLSGNKENIVAMPCPPQNFNFCSLGGTNILEATILGHGVLEQMDVEHKTLFVLTDGDDSYGWNCCLDSATMQEKSFGWRENTDDIYFNGDTVDNIIMKTYGDSGSGQSRINAHRVVNDFYKTKGHKTTGISWNYASSTLDFMIGQKVLTIQSDDLNGNYSRAEYTEMSNFFINEIVDSLL